MFGGKGSARSWLQGLTANASARGADAADLTEEGVGLEDFLSTAPQASRQGLSDFLAGEGIEDVDSLHTALRSSGPDGSPQILERARSRLIAGAFSHLRSACDRAGGLQPAAPIPPGTRGRITSKRGSARLQTSTLALRRRGIRRTPSASTPI